MNEETEVKLNPDCPCKRTKCSRHGNCVACRERHAGKDEPPACMRPSQKEKRALRRQNRGKTE